MYILRPLNPHTRQTSEVDLEIGQVEVLHAASPELQLAHHRARYAPSGDQIVALITRLATASRSAGLNADHVLTDDDLRPAPYRAGKPSE